MRAYSNGRNPPCVWLVSTQSRPPAHGTGDRQRVARHFVRRRGAGDTPGLAAGPRHPFAKTKDIPAERATLGGQTRTVEEIDRTHPHTRPRRPGWPPSIARGVAHTWSTTRKISDPPDNREFQTMKSTQCQAPSAGPKNITFQWLTAHFA